MIILRFLLSILFVFAAATMSMPDGFENGRHIEMTVLSKERAQRLFDEFVGHDEIPFGYPVDGCYARATAMVRIAEDEKITMGKVWAEGRLRIISPNPRIGEVEWTYHTAPTAFVKDQDGKALLMVFDPSLFKTPVSLQEWLNIMKTPEPPFFPERSPFTGINNFLDRLFSPRIDNVYYGERFQYWPRKLERKKYSWHSADLKNMKKVMDRHKKYEESLRPENSLANKIKNILNSKAVK